MFFKLLSHDLNNGIRKRLAYYATALVISLTFCQGCYLVIQSLNRRGVVALSGNLADYLVYLFQGMEVYYPGPDTPFIFIAVGIILCVSGCGSGYAPSNAAIVETDVEAITFEASAVPEEEQELLESCPVGTFFMHPAMKEGFLQIRVDSAAVYDNWKEAELPFDELRQFTDSVSSMDEDLPYDQTMFYEDGGVVDGYQLIILSITIRNENAVPQVRQCPS